LSLAGNAGDTALMAAAASGRAAVVRELAARGAALDATHAFHDATAFYKACHHNQPECVTALVELGCDTRIKCINGRTGSAALAQQMGHAVVLQVLRAAATEWRHALEAERAATALREEAGWLIARRAFAAAAPLLAGMLRDAPADPELLAWEAEVAAAEAEAEANAAALLAEEETEGSGGGSAGGQSK
jgi:hypothetical protein